MVEKSASKEKNLELIMQFLNTLQIHPIDNHIAKIYGSLKSDLFEKFAPKEKKKRRRFKMNQTNIGISDNDLWIASIAQHHKLTILTRDRDFDKIKEVSGILTESWKE